MKFQKLTILGAVLAAVQLASPVKAQEMAQPEFLSQTPEAIDSELYLADLPPPSGPPMVSSVGLGCGMFDQLGLSDEQLEKLVNLKTQLSISTAQKKAEMKGKHHQMMDLLSQPAVEKQKVLALQGEINSLRDDLSNSRANFMVDASSVFTAEQKKQLHHMMLTRMLKMGGPGQRFLPHGPGHHGQWQPHRH